MTTHKTFDEYAENYDVTLAQALSASGEEKSYFARGRIAWLADCLRQLHDRPKLLMDYGCGTGSATPFLFDVLGGEFVLGIDVSSRSLDVAKRTYGSERAQFLPFDAYQPRELMDLAYSNGVFHHIPPGARAAAAQYVYSSLRPGGLFSFWENNPWNPGTRYVMAHCEFDRDAITLTPPKARRMLIAVGFEVLRTDFLFIFPKALRLLRFLEAPASRLPLGAQYQVLCRKPEQGR